MLQNWALVAVLATALLLLPPHVLAVPSWAGGQSLRPAFEVEKHHKGAEITQVPGFEGKLPSRQYGGYITVNEERGRHLYYYFVTSQRSPSKDPVMLWLNGGPGCSSFDGFVYEHGPFKFSFKGGKDDLGRQKQELVLDENPYAWSRVANVLYVDSPAGTGMSYSETHEDYHTNDTHTAADLNTFLRRWFTRYSEYQQNDFFIAGESYAGVYVPLTSQAVLNGNDAGQQPQLRLRGYMVGNGVVDQRYDGNALVPFAYGKSLISHELHEEVKGACGSEYWNFSEHEGSACHHALNKVYAAVSGVNLYNILETCYHGHNPYHASEQLGAALASHRQWPLLGAVPEGPVPGFGDLFGQQLGHTPPCLDSREMWAFCNSDEVRQAIHAEPISKIGSFDECTNGDRIRYTHNAGSMLPVHQDIISRGLSALIYSGDHDMCVPHTGTEAWTSWLGSQLGEERSWAPWFTADHQVAGYSIQYQGLTYATVRGAGHMVPESKPAESLHMVTRFMERLKLE